MLRSVTVVPPRLNDPWGDLVNYFREISLTLVKYGLVARAIDGLAETMPAPPGAATTPKAAA